LADCACSLAARSTFSALAESCVLERTKSRSARACPEVASLVLRAIVRISLAPCTRAWVAVVCSLAAVAMLRVSSLTRTALCDS
jgi:hypothetical protein